MYIIKYNSNQIDTCYSEIIGWDMVLTYNLKFNTKDVELWKDGVKL